MFISITISEKNNVFYADRESISFHRRSSDCSRLSVCSIFQKINLPGTTMKARADNVGRYPPFPGLAAATVILSYFFVSPGHPGAVTFDSDGRYPEQTFSQASSL